jgi:hypothetical protein
MSALLQLVRAHREALNDSGVEPLSDAELLLELASSLVSLADSTDVRGDCVAIARAIAVVWFCSPDCSRAMAPLRDAGIGDFDLDDLNEVRRHPACAEIKKIWAAASTASTSSSSIDYDDLCRQYLEMRALAIEAGGICDTDDRDGRGQ